MYNDIIYNVDLYDKLRIGVDKVANSVKVTLGAKGRNVLIDQENQDPIITKDGVTVARSIFLEEPVESMGAKLIKRVAHDTNEKTGDGTTTATILAQSIFNKGLKYINYDTNPILMKNGIDKAVETVVKNLKSIAKKVSSEDDLINVATISANGDSNIGSNIANAIKLVSKDGVITIMESSGTETNVEVTEGMQFNKGYLSPYFVTDQAKMEVVFDNPLILICGKKIGLAIELIKALEISVKEKRPLLIIADEIDSQALQVLIVNKMQGILQVAAVKSPAYGSSRHDMLEDIAIMTGGFVMDANLGVKLEDISIDQLGGASKVIINANETIVIGGDGDKQEIESRVALIREQIKNAPSSYDAERIQERLSKMAGGVAIIYVGGKSEVEIKERKDRFDDALNATRAAIEEGIVPGGGVALLRCLSSLDSVVVTSEDEMFGVKIIREAIKEPFRTIIGNANLPVDVIYQNITSPNSDFVKNIDQVLDFGYNVLNNRYELFFETGVIDPVKVTRIALENAASIAGLLLTTQCSVYIKQKNNE